MDFQANKIWFSIHELVEATLQMDATILCCRFYDRHESNDVNHYRSATECVLCFTDSDKTKLLSRGNISSNRSGTVLPSTVSSTACPIYWHHQWATQDAPTPTGRTQLGIYDETQILSHFFRPLVSVFIWFVLLSFERKNYFLIKPMYFFPSDRLYICKLRSMYCQCVR